MPIPGIPLAYEKAAVIELLAWLRSAAGSITPATTVLPGAPAAFPVFPAPAQVAFVGSELARHYGLVAHPMPFPFPQLALYQMWHERYDDDSAHR